MKFFEVKLSNKPFLMEQMLFSSSTFLFSRNVFSKSDIGTVATIGVYLVIFSTIVTILRPISLKYYANSIEMCSDTGKQSFFLVLCKMKVQIVLSLLIPILFLFFLPAILQIKILIIFVGFTMIIIDIGRFQNIVDGLPQLNFLSNFMVLGGAVFSLAIFTHLTLNTMLIFWIFMQTFGLIVLIESRSKVRRNLSLLGSDFSKFGDILLIESFVSQCTAIVFFTAVTFVNLEYSGMLRVGILALTTFPAMYYSAVATPNSLSIERNEISVRNQIIHVVTVPFAFLFFSLFMIFVPGLTRVVSGREIGDFYSAAFGAINIAINIAILSHLGFPFIGILGTKKYLILKLFGPAFYYLGFIIILQSGHLLYLNCFMILYTLIMLTQVLVIIYITGRKVEQI